MTRILGIDPGNARCGWGVIEEDGGRFALVECGCLSTKPAVSREGRLLQVYEGLAELMDRLQPDEVAVEQLFFNKNVGSAMAVGEARGVALLAAAQRGLRLAEYTPSKVKEALSGSGRASKDEVRLMVMMQLGLEKPPRPDDISDALAIALTHLFWRQLDGAGFR